MDTHEQKQIKMILDLHGHTQKRKAFFYGCTDRNAPHKTRLFPYLVSKLSSIFDFSSCNFAMERSKEATARITLYNMIRAPEIFTLEISQFGLMDRFLGSAGFEEIAVTLCRAMAKMYKINRPASIPMQMTFTTGRSQGERQKEPLNQILTIGPAYFAGEADDI
jgi:hypothetical protein